VDRCVEKRGACVWLILSCHRHNVDMCERIRTCPFSYMFYYMLRHYQMHGFGEVVVVRLGHGICIVRGNRKPSNIIVCAGCD
jgi:hypothetical protein